MQKIGAEEHFHTRSYVQHLYNRKSWPKREIIEEKGGPKIREWWAPGKCRIMPLESETMLCDFEHRVMLMDKYGIDAQILSLSFPGVEYFEQDEAIYISKKVNDEIAEIVSRYPNRFYVLATLPVQAPQAAADELERCVKYLGFRGAVINGNIRGEYTDEKKYWVIFECAHDLGVPIYLHPRIPPVDFLSYFDPYPGLHTAMMGFAVDASLQALRIMLSGIIDMFPNLKLILGHLGEGIPFWLWRLDSRWKEEIETNPESAQFYITKKKPSDYFLQNFYVTTSGMFWEPALQFVQYVLGADRILFATDFPYESTEVAVHFIEEAKINPWDKEKICYNNAQILFNIK